MIWSPAGRWMPSRWGAVQELRKVNHTKQHLFINGHPCSLACISIQGENTSLTITLIFHTYLAITNIKDTLETFQYLTVFVYRTVYSTNIMIFIHRLSFRDLPLSPPSGVRKVMGSLLGPLPFLLNTLTVSLYSE